MNATELVTQGLRHHGAGDLAAADRLYRQALAIDPAQADALHLRGVIAHQRGLHEDAIVLISAAVARQPRNGAFLNNLGEALRAQHRYADAIRCYRDALQVNPRDANALNNLGLALHLTHRFGEAEQCFADAVRLAPGDPETLMNLGNLFRDLKRLPEAMNCFREAIERVPGFAPAHAWLGVTLYEAGHGDAAVDALVRATELAPLDIEAHNNLKRVRWNLDQREHLHDSFRRACELLPQVPDTHLNLAESLLRNALYEQAKTAIERALRIAPDMARAHSLLGRAYEGLGQVEAAVIAHERALELDPDEPLLREECANALLLGKQFPRATDVLRRAHELSPRRSGVLARLNIAMNETRDPARHEWVDYERFVHPQLIDVPPGFDSLEQFNAALHAQLSEQHLTPNHALEQTMRGGTQTLNNLFQNPTGLAAILKEQISKIVDQYIAHLPAGDNHPFLRFANREYVYTGAWSTILHASGFDGAHIHNEGWLSGTYYVQVPELTGQQHAAHEGYIQFGEPPQRFASERNNTCRVIAPQVGMAVLFPSYYWHGVRAFSAGGIRHSVSFDII